MMASDGERNAIVCKPAVDSCDDELHVDIFPGAMWPRIDSALALSFPTLERSQSYGHIPML
jgi:hypothetical protein